MSEIPIVDNRERSLRAGCDTEEALAMFRREGATVVPDRSFTHGPGANGAVTIHEVVAVVTDDKTDEAISYIMREGKEGALKEVSIEDVQKFRKMGETGKYSTAAMREAVRKRGAWFTVDNGDQISAISASQALDDYVSTLTEEDRGRLDKYARFLHAKKRAQEAGDGKGSILSGQYAGQELMAMSPGARQRASEYLNLWELANDS